MMETAAIKYLVKYKLTVYKAIVVVVFSVSEMKKLNA